MTTKLFVCSSYPFSDYPTISELTIFDVYYGDTFYGKAVAYCIFKTSFSILVEICPWVCVHGKDKNVCVSKFACINVYSCIYKVFNITLCLCLLLLCRFVASTRE